MYTTLLSHNMYSKSNIKLFVIFELIRVIRCAEWSYDGDTGPEFWCDLYETCCGSRQSPIDLRLLKLTIKEAFRFEAYDELPSSATMFNNGHSIAVTFSSDIVPRMSGGGLNGTYFFHSLHMHWGSNDNSGSEHTFSRRSFPMEMHLVHYNSRFSSIGAAIGSKQSDALAVLGIMFETGLVSHPSLQKMISPMNYVLFNDQSVSIDPFSLGSMLPNSQALFFRYMGSLTTPTCNEVVAWTVFVAINHMSRQQVQKLREVYASNVGEPAVGMSDNYRPVLPLSGRQLEKVIAV